MCTHYTNLLSVVAVTRTQFEFFALTILGEEMLESSNTEDDEETDEEDGRQDDRDLIKLQKTQEQTDEEADGKRSQNRFFASIQTVTFMGCAIKL